MSGISADNLTRLINYWGQIPEFALGLLDRYNTRNDPTMLAITNRMIDNANTVDPSVQRSREYADMMNQLQINLAQNDPLAPMAAAAGQARTPFYYHFRGMDTPDNAPIESFEPNKLAQFINDPVGRTMEFLGTPGGRAATGLGLASMFINRNPARGTGGAEAAPYVGDPRFAPQESQTSAMLRRLLGDRLSKPVLTLVGDGNGGSGKELLVGGEGATVIPHDLTERLLKSGVVPDDKKKLGGRIGLRNATQNTGTESMLNSAPPAPGGGLLSNLRQSTNNALSNIRSQGRDAANNLLRNAAERRIDRVGEERFMNNLNNAVNTVRPAINPQMAQQMEADAAAAAPPTAAQQDNASYQAAVDQANQAAQALIASIGQQNVMNAQTPTAVQNYLDVQWQDPALLNQLANQATQQSVLTQQLVNNPYSFGADQQTALYNQGKERLDAETAALKRALAERGNVNSGAYQKALLDADTSRLQQLVNLNRDIGIAAAQQNASDLRSAAGLEQSDLSRMQRGLFTAASLQSGNAQNRAQLLNNQANLLMQQNRDYAQAGLQDQQMRMNALNSALGNLTSLETQRMASDNSELSALAQLLGYQLNPGSVSSPQMDMPVHEDGGGTDWGAFGDLFGEFGGHLTRGFADGGGGDGGGGGGEGAGGAGDVTSALMTAAQIAMMMG